MKKKIIALVIALVMLAVASIIAFAQNSNAYTVKPYAVYVTHCKGERSYAHYRKNIKRADITYNRKLRKMHHTSGIAYVAKYHHGKRISYLSNACPYSGKHHG